MGENWVFQRNRSEVSVQASPTMIYIAHSETRNLQSTDPGSYINFDVMRTTYKNVLMLLMLNLMYRSALRCHHAVDFYISVVDHSPRSTRSVAGLSRVATLCKSPTIREPSLRLCVLKRPDNLSIFCSAPVALALLI
jgi:hypothetical protein